LAALNAASAPAQFSFAANDAPTATCPGLICIASSVIKVVLGSVATVSSRVSFGLMYGFMEKVVGFSVATPPSTSSPF
jgi:hypothetical protein